MPAAGLLITGLCIVLCAWLARRRVHTALRRGRAAASAQAVPPTVGRPTDVIAPADDSLHAGVEIEQVAAVNALIAGRLWKLAYGAPAHAESWDAAHGLIHSQVTASLRAAQLDAKNLPRRPTLMPQLLHALDEPHTASEKLSRIVAHDPVLTTDVLRLANSSRYRNSTQPIETIHRAIVILGVEALRGLLASAMLQPIFRATRSNFPRFPRLLWERTERATHAAQLFALQTWPPDRFEAQLSALLSALGPLVVYTTVLDAYAHHAHLSPDPGMCAALTGTLGPPLAIQIARHWQISPRLLAAMEHNPREALAQALCVGELAGTLSMLTTHEVLNLEEADGLIGRAGLPPSLVRGLLSDYGGAERTLVGVAR